MPPKQPDTGRQRQNAEIRKPEIVKSFYQTILEQGLEGASIAKVAARIRIHPSLILHYFGSKESLTLALVDYVIDEYARLFQTIRLGGLEPAARLEKLIEIIWSRQYYEKIHIASSFSMIAVSFRNPRIHEKIQGLYASFQHFLAKEIQRACDAGAIEAQDSVRAANRVITLVEGARHFRHFFVHHNRVKQYNHDMKEATKMMLKMK
ncbi:AcrR family transcriptional regulator [Desulfosalsimonas propionicica]|uniref:Biofilm operon icaADBC HTH-type negative transcriptional regulator IcaR n=1 Tax=Desulfosalsimonas propionicica TaxID=332175 RepID=A0A7W0HM09_9BACT|nr:TetR/AcrR family transcriptional regulator [Desulfosalsimonas propionicica]MBA2882889.1 AcrR family transcriptional regulator [Desulfosalsimonas propionicica]